MSNLKGTSVTWLGHSFVHVQTQVGTSILIDPFMEQNPSFPKGYAMPEKVDLILITHGHFDHIADAVPLAKKYDAMVVAIFEVAAWLESKGVEKTTGMNIGGSFRFQDVVATMVEAAAVCGATRSLVDLTLGLKGFGVDSKVLSPFEGPVSSLLRSQGVEHEVIPFQRTMAPCPNRVVLTRLRRAASNLAIFGNKIRLVRSGYRLHELVGDFGGMAAREVRSSACVAPARNGRSRLWALSRLWFNSIPAAASNIERVIIANSNAVRDHVCPEGIRDRVNVIYNGIAPRDRFEHLLKARQPANSKRPNFIMAGAVIPGKGQIEAIQALAVVRAYVPDANLTILGWGPDAYVSECRTFASTWDLAKQWNSLVT